MERSRLFWTLALAAVLSCSGGDDTAGPLEGEPADAGPFTGLPPETRLVALEHERLIDVCEQGQQRTVEVAGLSFSRGSCLFAFGFIARAMGAAADPESLCGDAFEDCLRDGGAALACDLAPARPECSADVGDYERCTAISGEVLRELAPSTCEWVVEHGVVGALEDAELASDFEACRQLLDPCIIGSGEAAGGR